MSGFQGKRILITGGLGFIGSNLADRLVGEGAHVTLLDNLHPDYGGNRANIRRFVDRVQVRISDVRDSSQLAPVIEGQDLLFNLAAQTSHLDSMKDPATDLDINSRAQLSIMETCRAVNPGIKIVYASTRQIYGRPTYLPVDERHPVTPVDVNGINKAAGERYHLLYSEVYGIRSCALRLTNTYGRHMRIRDARQTFLGIWLRRVVEGQPFEVWGGDQLRDFTYVDDVVDAFCRAATSDAADGRTFNVGGDEIISLRDLAAMLVRVAGAGSFEIRPFPEERARIEIGDYYSDDRLIRSTLGWQPTVRLEEGLQRSLAFYRENLALYA